MKFPAACLLLLLALAGCQSRPAAEAMPVVARFWLETDSVRAVAVRLPVSELLIPLAPRPVITEFDIVNVELAEVELGRCLMFQLTPGASRDLFRLSAANQGRRLVVFINDEPAGVRLIERPVEGGVLYTFLEKPEAELPEIVRGLKRTAATIRQAAAK